MGEYGGSEMAGNLRDADKLGGRIEYDTNPTPNVSHILVPASYKRRALIVSAPLTGKVTLSNDTPAVAGNGLVLAAGTSWQILTRETCGDALYKAWYAIGDASTTICGFIDVMEPTHCYRGVSRESGAIGAWPGHS